MSSGLFKNVIYKLFVYLIYMYYQDLALNNPQKMVCLKTRPFNKFSTAISLIGDPQVLEQFIEI